MATNEQLIPIPGRLHSLAPEGHVAGADEIYDDDLQKSQSDINADVKVMGASGENHSKGLVPDPGATQGNTKYLREDGTWATPAGQDYTEGNGISISSNAISVKAGSNLSFDASGNLNAADTTYSEATTSESGLMSASDKTKLDGIQAGAQVHIAPTANEVKTALGTTSGTTKYLREDGTWNVPAGSDFTNVAFLEDASEEAVTPSFDPQADTVHVTAQSLTSAQKTQARTNIDALGSSDLTGYATQTWVQSQGYLTQHQDISGLESKVAIESASGTTLTAEVGKYYRFDSAVSSLAVTLPTISNATTIQGCVFYLTTSSSVTLTFTGGGTVKYQDGYEIKASSTYEINAIWNGAVWVIASIKIA